MKKILLSSVVLLSLIYSSQTVYGETTSSSTTNSNIATTDSTFTTTNDLASSTTSSSVETDTSSSSSTQAESEYSTTIDSSRTSTESQSSSSVDSSSTSSSTKPTTVPTPEPTEKPSAVPKPFLTAKNGQYNVENGVKLTKNDLLSLVSYTYGDKSNLDIVITSNYAYVSKNGQQNSKVYHTDLDALLGTANLNNIQLMTISQAKKLGLTLAQGNANKNIEVINCSLPGQYNVSFTDKNNPETTIQTTVTIGNPASSLSTENTENSVTVNSTVNNVPVQNEISNVNTLSQKEAKTMPNSASKATLPKTGEKGNHTLPIVGLFFLLVSSAFILIKKIG